MYHKNSEDDDLPETSPSSVAEIPQRSSFSKKRVKRKKRNQRNVTFKKLPIISLFSFFCV